MEAQNLRHLDLTNPVAVVPIGIDVPAIPAVSTGDNGAVRVVTCVGRPHPDKNLEALPEAWAHDRRPR